jgi:hypothetical protein
MAAQDVEDRIAVVRDRVISGAATMVVVEHLHHHP